MAKLPLWLATYLARKGLESLPLPSRGQSWGRYPSWADMLAQIGNAAQPIQPSEANNGTDNSVVNICINYIATSWQVAVMQVGTQPEPSPESFAPLPAHPLLDLLNAPSADCDGATLHWALIADYVRFGNAYAHKVRTNARKVLRLEWLPARYMAPVPEEKTGRLKHYKYQPAGMSEAFIIQPEDVVHIRHGLDEFFPLQGVSPLAAQYREIVTDNKYSDYAAGLARNAGMSPILLTPRRSNDSMGGYSPLTREDAEYLTQTLAEKMKSDPGGIRMLNESLDVEKLSYSPDEMALLDVRAMPETRIPAALGLPALLLQLLTGIQKSTFSNFETATAQGWRGCIIPMQSVFASAFNRQLLPDFEKENRRGLKFRYDYSTVPELQGDELAGRLADREDVKAGVLTPDEARERQGLGKMPESEKLPAPQEPEPPATTPEQKMRANLRALGWDSISTNSERVNGKPEFHALGISGNHTFNVGHGATPHEAEADLITKAAAYLGVELPYPPILKREVPVTEGADIYEVADAYRRALAADEQAAMDEVARAWNRSRRAIESELKDVLAALEGLDSLEGSARQDWLQMLSEQLAAKVEVIDGILSDLADKGAAITENAQRAAIATSINGMPSLAQAMAGPSPTGVALGWNRLSPDTFEALIGLSSDGSPLGQLLATFGAETGQAIRQGLLDAIALGENPRQAAARLSATFGTSRARMEAIARTEMLRASREACRRTYRANADVLDGYTRLSAADERTCVSCWALHGKQSESSEIMPTHVNCRCALVPTVKSWAELLGDSTLPDTRPVIETGPELFAALPEEMQASVLGPSRLALYQAGTPLSEMTETQGSEWGPTTRIKPIAEVAA